MKNSRLILFLSFACMFMVISKDDALYSTIYLVLQIIILTAYAFMCEIESRKR